MLTPEYLYRISEASEEISGELHEYIVRRIIEGIMNRIGRGESYLLTARNRITTRKHISCRNRMMPILNTAMRTV